MTITKHGQDPARITVQDGSKTTSVTEKELDKLPKDIRPYVDPMLGPAGWRGMVAGKAGVGPADRGQPGRGRGRAGNVPFRDPSAKAARRHEPADRGDAEIVGATEAEGCPAGQAAARKIQEPAGGATGPELRFKTRVQPNPSPPFLPAEAGGPGGGFFIGEANGDCRANQDYSRCNGRSRSRKRGTRRHLASPALRAYRSSQLHRTQISTVNNPA